MIKKIFANLSIKFKFIIGIVTILMIAMFSLSIVFIKQSERLLIEALESKANLLNKNFSIVSANSIEEYSFTNLQVLINEAAAKDREIKILIVADVRGLIIATSDDENYQQFTKVEKEEIIRQIEKKQNIIFRNKQDKLLESVCYIYSRPHGAGTETSAPPVRGKPIGFIYTALDMTFLEESISKLWIYSIILTMVLMGCGTAGAYLVGSSMSRPIGELAKEVRVISSGNLDNSIKSGSRDEIGQLVTDVEKMRLSIKDLTENLEAKVQERTTQLQEANEKIRQAMDALWGEMELAKKIQTVLLPVRPEIPGYDIAASLEPADEVGGDYYDIISAKGYDWIIIGDVSGHGVPAGLIMMMAQTAIHTVLSEHPEMPVSQLLAVVNTTISANIRRLGDSKYMTMTVMAGVRDGYFSFSGLHQDIMIYRARRAKVEAIETTGMWLGLEPDISEMLVVDDLKLELGDCMVLFTDGVTEAKDKDGEMFGHERLLKIIERSGDKLALEIHQAVIDELKPYEKPDDVTLVVLKRLV
ncbi:MAG: SpoIIE family protein phosphatase [Desulfobacterales bacterium]|nr:SpoIIE family protein phosphatase [Desulfobacterales bacterium]